MTKDAKAGLITGAIIAACFGLLATAKFMPFGLFLIAALLFVAILVVLITALYWLVRDSIE